jgi:uncharacterized protein (DUF2141 family)
MISLQKKLSYLICIGIATACANIQTPSGGPSDKKAPQLKSSTPKQNSLNFQGTDIILEFDEQVNADKLKSSLVITPLKEEDDFKVKVKKKTVFILFERKFQPNTTYTLNFSDAIVDLTEKNVAQDLTLSFSTGSYMDSIALSGNVKDLKTNTPLQNITVALYQSGDTSSLKKGKPEYFNLSDKTGAFNFRNLKNGQYDLYAFQDKNKNVHYEENETIGFIENFDLNKNKSNVIISLTVLDTRPPELTYILPGNEKTEIKFNEGIVLKSIYYQSSDIPIAYLITEDAKSIFVYNNLITYDSLPINLEVSDSTGNITNLKKNIIFEKNTQKKEALASKVEPLDYKLDPGYINIKITFNKPIKSFKNNIKVYADKTLIELDDSNYVWNINKTMLSINKKIKQADSVIIETNKNTFISTMNDSLASQILKFSTKKEEDYGIIRGTADTKQSSYILELLDNSYKPIKSLKNIRNFSFTYLKPATYNIRVIIDENNNGKWDNGNLELNQEPEKIIYAKEKIQLRANWEIENIVLKF